MDGKNFNFSKKNSNSGDTIAEIDISVENTPYNQFYDHISIFYKVVSLIFIVSFLLYIVITAFNNASAFSYENFEYIIRNFALTLDENKDDSVFSIEYNPDSNRQYALFGKGLAVCGNSGISIYSATGRLTCSEPLDYENPRMAASDKFVLVYDYSDSEYSIHNAFSRVYSEKIPESIRGAAVSSNGYYALITSSEQYNTAVELYDDTFSLINRFNKNGFVVDVDITDRYLMIATASDSDNNSFSNEIQVFDIKEQRELFSVSAPDNFPLECIISKEGFELIGSKCAEFYSFDGRITGTYDYNGKTPINFSQNNGSTILLFKNEGFNSEYRAVVLNETGSIIYEHSVISTVFDVEISNKWAFFLTERFLICTDGDTVHKLEVEAVKAGNSLLSFDDSKVFVCTDTAAPIYTVPLN